MEEDPYMPLMLKNTRPVAVSLVAVENWARELGTDR